MPCRPRMTIQEKVRTTTLVRIGRITRNSSTLCQRALARARRSRRSDSRTARHSSVALTPSSSVSPQDRVVEGVGEELDVVARAVSVAASPRRSMQATARAGRSSGATKNSREQRRERQDSQPVDVARPVHVRRISCAARDSRCLISRLKRSISAPRCGLSFSQSNDAHLGKIGVASWRSTW